MVAINPSATMAKWTIKPADPQGVGVYTELDLEFPNLNWKYSLSDVRLECQ